MAEIAKALSSRAALLGVGFLIALAARSQEPASPPATGPTAIRAPGPLVALPCVSSPARGTFSPPQMPLPKELQGDILLVKSGAFKISGKAPSVKPWAVKDLKVGRNVGSSLEINMMAFNAIFGFQSMSVQQSFTFRLVREDSPDAPAVTARCTWGLASSTPSLGKGSWGIEMRIPQGTSTACELFDASEAEPWRLFLWVDVPSNIVNPEFPSGGGLVRGAVRYGSTSTNVMKPTVLGMRATKMTGTVFTNEGRVLAAVERVGAGRILMQCSLPPAEQSLFVAVGAALFIRDMQAMSYEY